MKTDKAKIACCPKCSIPLTDWWRGSADPYPCPACGTKLKIAVREIKNDDSWHIAFFLPPILDFIWWIFFHRTPIEITGIEIVGGPDPSFRPTSDRTEFEEIQKSAEEGDAASQFKMGGECELGHWVERSEIVALTWYQKSAAQGHNRAQQAVGRMYFMGEGTERNYEESCFWYYVAEKNGEDREWSESVGRYLSAKQIAAQQERAASWQPVKTNPAS